MSRTSATRDAWHPQTRHDREAILLELQQILASPHFCNSKRYPALLQYVVEKTLAGEEDLLKERTLGVEVFDRAPSYDTNTDTVVRYTAGEVRKRLSLYYHELGRKPAIRISLPAGSYVPEFLHPHEEAEAGPVHSVDSVAVIHEPEPLEQWALAESEHRTATEIDGHRLPPMRAHAARRWWIGVLTLLAASALTGAGYKYRAGHAKTPIDEFWGPVLRDQSSVMMCIGGSVFSQSHTSGVATATKDIDYPFVSMQSASAVAQLSALLQRSGGETTQLQPAATTPLTELRDHPVILLGGYNNQWTLRLTQPLRFHFLPVDAGEAIMDEANPGLKWERDPSLPYSSADDYALLARFRDTTTGSWVVVLAGVGRNGTEAAAHFASSPNYVQLLRDRAGSDFSNRNVEAVLKVNVIDGKTGAPSIVAVHLW